MYYTKEFIYSPFTVVTSLNNSWFSIVDTDSNHCTLSSPSFLEWDAASVFLEGVMSRMFTSKAENKPEPQQGVDLLNNVLSFEANVSLS